MKFLKVLRHEARRRLMSTAAAAAGQQSPRLRVNGVTYTRDDYTNVTDKTLGLLGRNLHNEAGHPLGLLKRRIVDHFYAGFVGRTGNPVFSVYDNLDPVVTVGQNFDSLLIPESHVSRNKSDCYYVNRSHLLRAHMTAHQTQLIKMGLDNFIAVGDVYRRDEVDATHYPVFHQADAVRLSTKHQLSRACGYELEVFETGRGHEDTCDRQGVHTVDATKVMENHLKATLLSLTQHLFGKDIPYRWVDVYFPFTHPSWELEIEHNGKWMEVLGCGIMRNAILQSVGATDRIGWAFGLGLERIAMRLYDIPDIRLFWSTDSGFLSQFEGADPYKVIKYKPVSVYPQCKSDLSFWLPDERCAFEPNNFFQIARDLGGDMIEQITLVDEFRHPKSGKTSLCYRIVYRHLERTLTQEEVNVVHTDIARAVSETMGVRIR